MVRLTHLHLVRWNNPERPVQIDSAPFSMAQLARAHKYMGPNLQGQLGDAAAFIAIDGTQQFANALGLGNSPIVFYLRGGKRATQIAGRGRAKPRGDDCIPENHTGQLQGRPRTLQIAFGFDLAHRHKNVGRLNFRNRQLPDGGGWQR